MKKYSIYILALLAALCSCSKEEKPQENKLPAANTSVFTATMEDVLGTKATFDNASKRASWEVGDLITVNEYSYAAESSGTTTTFRDNNGGVYEIRPTYVSSSVAGPSNDPSILVDDAGISTNWCTPDKSNQDVIVSTPSAIRLKSIKLFNGEYDLVTHCWRGLTVSGSNDQNTWDVLFQKSSSDKFYNDLGKDKNALAAEVAINATEDYMYYKLDIELGSNTGNMADMKFVVEGPAPVESPYVAYFPADIYNLTQQKSILPSAVTETWADGKFNMPMYASSTTTSFQFKNLCGVLKITVKNSEIPSVKKIKVSSKNKAMSGVFTVVDDAAVLVSPDVVANTVSVYYTSEVATTAEGTVFYVAVPAQTYRDLKIEVSNDYDGRYMRTVSGRDIVVERNKIYSITFVGEDVPAGSRGTAMRTGDVSVPWVQLWKYGPKWATYNVLAENDSPEDIGGLFFYGSSSPANREPLPTWADYSRTPQYNEDLPENEDTAFNHWGSLWKMPIKDNFKDLINNCDYEWTTVNGVAGGRFTGKGDYSCNSIFFPAASRLDLFYGHTFSTEAAYFSSTSADLQGAYYLYCNTTRAGYNVTERHYACCIRAILK